MLPRTFHKHAMEHVNSETEQMPIYTISDEIRTVIARATPEGKIVWNVVKIDNYRVPGEAYIEPLLSINGKLSQLDGAYFKATSIPFGIEKS